LSGRKDDGGSKKRVLDEGERGKESVGEERRAAVLFVGFDDG
jgi:hypothetical protein